MNVELRYLHAFRTVCEAGGLRAAAAVLHRTEQSVSYQIRRLEESLGLPLFERRGGRLHLNAAGERLLDFCRGMEHDFERLYEEMRDAGRPQEPLRVSSVRGYGRYVVLPHFLEGGLTDLPLRIQYYATTDNVVRNVALGDSHLGFVFAPPQDARVTATPIDHEDIVLISPAQDAPPTLDVASLENESFITYDESDFVFSTWFRHVLGSATPQISVAAHFEEMEEVIAWVAAGGGLSILPAACLQEHEALDNVLVMREPRAVCRNTIYALTRPGHGHPGVERTLEALRDAATRRDQAPAAAKAATSPDVR